MCGIGGWLSSKQVPRAQLERIAGLFIKGLAHRGQMTLVFTLKRIQGLPLLI